MVIEGVNNTAVASLDDDVTMAWKEDVVRGSLFWLAQPLRNFSAQQQPLVKLGKETFATLPMASSMEECSKASIASLFLSITPSNT